MRDLYKELKEKDYDLYIETINKAGMISLSAGLSLKAGANLEKSMVEFVLDKIK